MDRKTYEYVVLLEGKPISRGQNLKKMWEDAKKKYPVKKLAIRYDPPEGILIAESNDLPPILGRVKGLDLFNANFEKCKMVNLK